MPCAEQDVTLVELISEVEHQKHLRRVLIESAWQYRHQPRVMQTRTL